MDASHPHEANEFAQLCAEIVATEPGVSAHEVSMRAERIIAGRNCACAERDEPRKLESWKEFVRELNRICAARGGDLLWLSCLAAEGNEKLAKFD